MQPPRDLSGEFVLDVIGSIDVNNVTASRSSQFRVDLEAVADAPGLTFTATPCYRDGYAQVTIVGASNVQTNMSSVHVTLYSHMWVAIC